jgi:hypothetical protein
MGLSDIKKMCIYDEVIILYFQPYLYFNFIILVQIFYLIYD